MSEKSLRYPLLERHYQQYLDDEDSARFIAQVTSHYMAGTLERLVGAGRPVTRRAAILAIGFVGDFSCNETIGLALSDKDRAVRMLAEHNIRQIWLRQGSSHERSVLLKLESLNTANQPERVVSHATELLRRNEQLCEAWNQRAVAHSVQGNLKQAILDCRETLNCNRYHFPAAVGMGHCLLKLNDPCAALNSFRLALRINPDLESLRLQVRRLEKILKDG